MLLQQYKGGLGTGGEGHTAGEFEGGVSIHMGLQELHNIHTIPRASAIIIIITTNMLLQAACLHFPVMCNAVSSLMRAFSAALAATFS